jgi:hypothetical protein
MFQPTGYSTYHSLQARLQKNLSNGLSFLTSYTFSKNIGVQGSDSFGDPFGGGGATAMDTFNRKLDKAILGSPNPCSGYFLNYELPFGHGVSHRLATRCSAVIGGWQVNSIEDTSPARLWRFGRRQHSPVWRRQPA